MALPVLAAMAVIQVVSSIGQGNIVKKQADIQRQMDEFNARLAEEDAWRAEAYGQTQMARYQTELDKMRGSTKVAGAAAGVNLNEGSLSEVVAESQMVGTLNMIDIQNQAYEQAMGFKREAANTRFASDRRRSNMYAQADAQTQAGITNALMNFGSAAYSGYSPKAKTGFQTSVQYAPDDSSYGDYVGGASLNRPMQLMMP